MSGFHWIKFFYKIGSLASKNLSIKEDWIVSIQKLQCEGVIDETYRNFLHAIGQTTAYSSVDSDSVYYVND